jgi:hypothetical protein
MKVEILIDHLNNYPHVEKNLPPHLIRQKMLFVNTSGQSRFELTALFF